MLEPINREDVINYVPGEVCVVVEPDGSLDGPTLYTAVQNRVNSWIRTHLTNRITPSDITAFDDDTNPTLLNALFGGNASVLSPRVRPGSASSRGWIILPAVPNSGQPANQYGRSETALLFYRIGAVVNPLPSNNLTALQQQRELVRELVVWVNRRISEGDLIVGDGGAPSARIVAVCPNWLHIAASNQGCGTPGGVPELVMAGDVPPLNTPAVTFPFNGGPTNPDAANIAVAVLDTCPDPNDLKRIAGSSKVPDSWLLDKVYDKISGSIDGPLSAPEASFGYLAGIGPREFGAKPFPIADHGLFVAGIVQSIAWGAGVDLSLSRVLSEYGVGDTEVIANALEGMVQKYQGQKNLIVNLSLGSEVPFNLEDRSAPGFLDSLFADERLIRWFPKTFVAVRDKSVTADKAAERVVPILDRARENLSCLFPWPLNSQVLVVAAVGNDALLTPRPDQPRYPAAYANVLGVAAVNRGKSKADYSNPGDERLNPLPANPDNGIGTFGGNANLNSGAIGPPRITPAVGQKDAIKGIFTAPAFPLGGGSNTTGWAYWVGTSFATPIISALAANYWQANPGKTAGDVITYIRNTISTHGPGALRAPVVDAEPT